MNAEPTSAPKRLGVMLPIPGIPLHEHRPWVEDIAKLGYDEAWVGEATEHDAVTPTALAAAWAPTLTLGTAILPVFTRGPALIAQTVASLCDAAPGRVVIGIGTSTEIIVRGWNDVPFEKPVQRVADVLKFLRVALTGSKVSERYATFQVSNFRLGCPVPQVQPEVLVAGLRPEMLRLAGKEGDGAIVNWFSPADLARALEFMQPGKQLVASVKVIPGEDYARVRETAARIVNAYFHVPTYRKSQEWLGRAKVLEPVWNAWASGDRRGATALIPDALIDELFVWGNAADLRAGVARYWASGATTALPIIYGETEDVRLALQALAPE
jgi:probable F420-dependent oxidoreductase